MPSSWQYHNHPQSIPQSFSTLEVTPQTSRHFESFKEMPSPSGLEGLSPVAVHPSTDARYSHDDAPEVVYSSHLSPENMSFSSPLPASYLDDTSGGLLNGKEFNDSHRAQRNIFGRASKRCWICVILAALTITIVVGLAIGITFGLRNAHRKDESASNGSSSQVPSTDNGITNGSSLAAIAFNDTLGVVHHRVYYQDHAGKIKESSWNASSKLWQVSNSAIGQAKLNTPLAAIVTGPLQYGFVSNNF